MKKIVLKDNISEKVVEKIVSDNQMKNEDFCISANKMSFARSLIRTEMKNDGVPFGEHIPINDEDKIRFFDEIEKRCDSIEIVEIKKLP